MKTSLHGIVASSKTRVRCVFCGVHIPKANRCIEQHTNGFRHKENIELMNENGISFFEDKLYCKLCKRELGEEESVTKHIDTDDHANWMVAVTDLLEGEFIMFDDYLASGKDKEEVYCEVCKTNLPCTLVSLEEHVNSYNHRFNLAEKLKPMNGIFPVDFDDELWCKVCYEYIDNTVQDILDHIDDDAKHVSWFADIEEIIVDQGVSVDLFLANEHHMYAYCSKCNAEIPCDIPTIEEHVLNESHLNNFS